MRIDYRSPNYAERGGASVSLLVMHYTGMPTAQAALERLCERQAEVSAHYLVDEDGTVYALVDEQYTAWHAGKSAWRGVQNVNTISIGIEIVNPGHEWGYRAFPSIQMQAVAVLSRGIIDRHAIEARNVVGHSDVAPCRKLDPGELFDWQWLAERGVGVWPSMASEEGFKNLCCAGERGAPVLQMQQSLMQYGYDCPQDGYFDAVTEAAALAFQRHFRPDRVDGQWDAQCDARLKALNLLVS